MSDYKPHHLFWKGFWQAIGGFFGLALCTYIASRIPQWREPVIGFVLNLAPSSSRELPLCLSLYLSGFLCLFLAYRIPVARIKREIENGTVIEAIGPHVPSQAIYSTLTAELESPKLSPKAFHVLKWFNQINSNTGAGDVQIVAHICGMDASDALACIQELWGLKFIKTAIVMPGEWNSHYAITQKGRDYVRENAT